MARVQKFSFLSYNIYIFNMDYCILSSFMLFPPNLGITQLISNFCNLRGSHPFKVSSPSRTNGIMGLVFYHLYHVWRGLKHRNCRQAKFCTFCKELNFHSFTQKYLLRANAHLFA